MKRIVAFFVAISLAVFCYGQEYTQKGKGIVIDSSKWKWNGTHIINKNTGNVGIGLVLPTAKLDVLTNARTGAHSTTSQGLYVTGNIPSMANNNLNNLTGVGFFHDNGTQGLRIGYDGIAIEGTHNNNNFNFKSQSGTFNFWAGSTSNNNTFQRSSGLVLANNHYVREFRYGGNFGTLLSDDFTQISNITAGSQNIYRQFGLREADGGVRNMMSLQNNQVTTTGTTGVPIAAQYGYLNFNNLVQNRRIVLYDNNQNSDHQFYGFGINGSTLRFQTPTGTQFSFFGGTSNTASQRVMNLSATGQLTLDQLKYGVNAPVISTLAMGINNVGNVSITNGISSLDDRANNRQPQFYQFGSYWEFKQATTVGLSTFQSGGATYVGLTTFRPYGFNTDFSGGQVRQEAIVHSGGTAQGRRLERYSTNTTTWGTWRIIDSGAATPNYASVAAANADINLTAGSVYTVTVGGGKQLFVK